MPIDIIQNIEKGVLPNTATTQLFLMDVEKFLDALPMQPIFDLVVTSPPYNIGKEYENQVPLSDYYDWQKRIIEKIYPRLKDNGSICWQVGNYVENGSITPLDIELAPIFKELNLHLRNRIIWHFGHGLHNKSRFSGRYEVIMWYTKSDTYTFNLDDVRVPAKYPGKRSYRGENKGKLSGNPKGKNPEDVWEIPNVKQTMRTQIYEHRSGLKVVPRDIVSDVEKILWDINPILSKRTVASIKESVRERLEKEGWTGEYRLDSSSRITISSYLKGIGMCFQTGNVGRIYADLLKLQTLYTRGNSSPN